MTKYYKWNEKYIADHKNAPFIYSFPYAKIVDDKYVWLYSTVHDEAYDIGWFPVCHNDFYSIPIIKNGKIWVESSEEELFLELL